MILQGREDQDTVKLVITVLDETKMVDGVETRIVEERETANGQLVEISRNYYAFCQENRSVFYFGEDVDIYKDGKIVGHEGNWQAGENHSRAGLMMPGQILLGAGYYQEMAPDVAMDRARILSISKKLATPAGVFDHCLVTEESSALERNLVENKIYAPGIGLIKDGNLLLTDYGSQRGK